MHIKMAALAHLGNLLTLVAWLALAAGPTVGVLKAYKAAKEEQRQEMVRRTAALRGVGTQRTYHL